MKKPVRIALISEHASPLALRGGEDAGGQNVYVEEISRHLAAQGYVIDIFTRRDNPAIPEIVTWTPGVRIIHLTAGPATFLSKDAIWPYMPAFRDAFLRFMTQEEIRYTLIHGNFWMSGWVAVELRRLLGIPVVQHFHALGVTKRRYQEQMDSSPKERIAIEAEVIKQCDLVIAPCPGERAELLEHYNADPRKIVQIPLAVNTDLFHPVPQFDARARIAPCVDLAPDDFVIVYVGRMLPRKDIRNVVRATARLVQQCKEELPWLVSKIKLLIVGGESAQADPVMTPEIGILRQLADELGIGAHVHCLGKRQQDTLRFYYSASDVVVTTPWYEPFGLTPLEGMACARPVIGSNVGGIAYTVLDGTTGFLVPPRDPEALADRLMDLLKSPQEAIRMGQNAVARIEQGFTWSAAAAHTAALFEEVIVSSISLPAYYPHTFRNKKKRYQHIQTA